MKLENGEYFVICFGLFIFWLYQFEIMKIPMIPTLSCLKCKHDFFFLEVSANSS